MLGPTWFTKYRRQAVKFLARTHVELAIDGIPVANADLLWSRPFQEDTSDPNSAWGVNWEYVLGRLGAGNSVDVNYKLVTDQTHWDGWANNPPGVTAELNCRVFHAQLINHRRRQMDVPSPHRAGASRG